MKQTMRNKTFETNSSSTHSLVLKKYAADSYTSASNKIVVDFIDTDSMYRASSLKEKVSYLVSQIINNYKYDVLDYEDLKEQVENDKKYLRRERKYYGKVERSFYLGEVDEDAIEATFNNGILKISIPKKQEEETRKVIDIK